MCEDHIQVVDHGDKRKRFQRADVADHCIQREHILIKHERAAFGGQTAGGVETGPIKILMGAGCG